MLEITVWQFQDFSVTQILGEINFGESRSSKNAIFGNFKASEFCSLGKNQPSKVQKLIKIRVQSL